MRSVALLLRRDAVAGAAAGQRREDMRELRARLVVQGVQPRWLEALDVLVEGVDEDGERQVALELRRAARQDEQAAPVRARAQLGQQAGLADAWFPRQLERARTSVLELDERLLQQAEFGGAPDELLGKGSHR